MYIMACRHIRFCLACRFNQSRRQTRMCVIRAFRCAAFCNRRSLGSLGLRDRLEFDIPTPSSISYISALVSSFDLLLRSFDLAFTGVLWSRFPILILFLLNRPVKPSFRVRSCSLSSSDARRSWSLSGASRDGLLSKLSSSETSSHRVRSSKLMVSELVILRVCSCVGSGIGIVDPRVLTSSVERAHCCLVTAYLGLCSPHSLAFQYAVDPCMRIIAPSKIVQRDVVLKYRCSGLFFTDCGAV